jgi:hypothetical protein
MLLRHWGGRTLDDIDLNGIWWIADDPSRRFTGQLTFSQDSGLRLETLDSDFEPPDFKDLFSDASSSSALIVGVMANGKYASLVDCLQSGTHVLSSGVVARSFIPHALVIGAQYESVDEIRFDAVAAEITNLLEWMGNPGIDVSYSKGTINASYVPQEKITVNVRNASITFAKGIETEHKGYGLTLTESAHVFVETHQPVPLSNLYDVMLRPIQYLLTLASRQVCPIIELTCFANDIVDDRHPGTTRRIPLTIVYPQILPLEHRDRTVFTQEMLFNLGTIRERLESLMPAWYEAMTRLSGTMTQLFAIRYAPFAYVEQRFTAATLAVEAFHRSEMSNEAMPTEQFRERRKAILSLVQPEWRDWLQQQIGRNDPSLRVRLTEIMGLVPNVANLLVDDHVKFANLVVKKRNALAHNLAANDKSVFDNKTLFFVTFAISSLVEACLLLNIGFREDEVLSMFKANQGFMQFARRTKESLNSL